MIPMPAIRMDVVRLILVVVLTTSVFGESPFVGNWTFDDSRTVSIREDGTAELSGDDGKVADGEWKVDVAGACLISWKNGDRHLVKLGGNGATLRGAQQVRGRVGSQTVSATREQIVEEDVASYFGSSSPTGNPLPPEDATEDVQDEESEPPPAEEGSYAEKMEEAPADDPAPIERTETQTVLVPVDARLSGDLIIERSSGTIANWKSEEGVACWSVAHLKPGKYQVAIEHSVGMGRNGGRFEVSTDSAKISSFARTTGGWKMFKRKPIGSIEITESDMELRFTATNVESGGSLMNIRSVELRRQ